MMHTKVQRRPIQPAARTADLLLERARRGQLGALEELYRLHEGAVYNLARRICRRPEEAEEVLQETFVEVARSLRAYRGDGSLSGWIRKIAASKALMRLRREKLRAAEKLDEASPPRPAARLDPEERGLARVDLEQALAALPDLTRAIVWLHDVEGYTHEEIAELCGKSVSFSKSRLARAHDRLRTTLSSGRRGGRS